MAKEPSAAQKLIGDIAPQLADRTDRVLFGEIWERPQLSKRDRSLATVGALVAMNRPDQLRFHLNYAAKWGERRRIDRGGYPFGFLLRLAQGNVCPDGRKGSTVEGVKRRTPNWKWTRSEYGTERRYSGKTSF